MDIKIPELLKTLTMTIINQMPEELWEWLDMTEETFYKDICNYVHLEEGKFTKEEIEKKIVGGPGDSGLSMLMEFYNNEWTVEVEDDEGEVEDMILYDARKKEEIDNFEIYWKLEEINPEWNKAEINLIDEDDGYEVYQYEL